MTIGIDLGDVWSHYYTLNQGGDMVGRGRFRTTPKAIEKWFTDLPPSRVAMEAGTHSIWISEQLQELGMKSSWQMCVSCERYRTAIVRHDCVPTLAPTRPSDNWQHRLFYRTPTAPSSHTTPLLVGSTVCFTSEDVSGIGLAELIKAC
jgi:hypothetical protein